MATKQRVAFRWVSDDGVTVCASPSFVTFWQGRPGGALLGGPFRVEAEDLEGLYREWLLAGRPA